MPAPTLISPPPSLRLTPEPLTADAFAPFGTVISSPLPRDLPAAPRASSALASLPLPHALAAAPVLANQGSALKYSPISPLENGYDGVCPSGKRAQARMSMFSCFPRRLRRESKKSNSTRSSRPAAAAAADDEILAAGGGNPVFDVRILERHPFTTQTFIPIDLSSQRRVVRDSDSGSIRGKAAFDDASGSHGDILLEEEVQEEDEPVFLVLVAPTLEGQSAAATVASPVSSSSSSPGGDNDNDGKQRVQIRDPPDLENLRAFIARGGQAVTYAAGTWHAPMVVLGRRRVDFVVVQFVNGVEEEDCQEVAFTEGIVADLGGILERGTETVEEWTGLLGRRVKL